MLLLQCYLLLIKSFLFSSWSCIGKILKKYTSESLIYIINCMIPFSRIILHTDSNKIYNFCLGKCARHREV
ncbi:hypothetical protein SteCoe_2034 [Stentor coeruleus]|uniref:Secreted protein n=1 Tax=Stentor coeruleus TaxID=5963 RepID=A0A1R2D0A9_9CILI|nr:hypothetical protein SteCoe_2034 [Stentor coeruleus]